MNRRRSLGMLGVTVASVLSVNSCKKDPLSDLDGKPAAIVKEFTQLHVAVGGTATFTASVVDGRFTPLEEPITFSTQAAGFSVAEDGSYDPIPPTSARAVVTGASVGSGYAIIQGGGLRDSVRVIVP
jgi:hypothetical protein